MSDLKEDLTVYHHIVFLEIIPLLEFHTRNYGTLAWRLEMTTVLPLVPMSEYTYSLRDYHPTSQPPEPQLSENETDTCLIDVGDVVMFDHSIPPPRSPPITPDEYSYSMMEFKSSSCHHRLSSSPRRLLVPHPFPQLVLPLHPCTLSSALLVFVRLA
jgi:hypothetical protein